ncbi:hypothetical protein X975_25078, partial [Stegodyphus mimosarum]
MSVHFFIIYGEENISSVWRYAILMNIHLSECCVRHDNRPLKSVSVEYCSCAVSISV